MDKPEWIYSWNWTEGDELRLSSAANKLDKLANELSALAETCTAQGKNSLALNLVSDAGTHFEDELDAWKQKMNNDVIANLRTSASAIRNTIAERSTLWDAFQNALKKFAEQEKLSGEDLAI